MNIFLLGAGRPATGYKPSALKNIALNTKVLDWQIHSFNSISASKRIHYLGGYHVEDIIKIYPQLNYTIIPDWNTKSILHSLLQAPFSNTPTIISYSDTVFRKDFIEKLIQNNSDVTFAIDTIWESRYKSRLQHDVQIAEKIDLEHFSSTQTGIAEFTGLIFLNESAASYVASLSESDVGVNLLDLLYYLQRNNFSVKVIDVAGEWAELNSPADVAHFILGSKAETLARLEPRVSHSHIGKQISFTTEEWEINSLAIIKKIINSFNGKSLVIRSSSMAEDNWTSSNAGSFNSLLNINSSERESVYDAVAMVISSYGKNKNSQDQVLVQEFLSEVQASGVVFTCSLETGAPYYHFNFDDKTQSTDSVTAGTHNDLRTIILSRFATEYLDLVEPKLLPVLQAVEELEQLLDFDKLDIEFAIDNTGLVHILQVRPITVDHSSFELELSSIKQSLSECQNSFHSSWAPSPFILGGKTVFANMPDWNPAEIIGIRPKPLAFSLYRQLITNDIWAQQRAEYGYRDVRPCPLILSFSGHPYVDSRASFNSFIPASLPEETALRLANAYINILADNPQYQDKIEFEIVFSIWTLGFVEAASTRLLPYGVKLEDIFLLEKALKDITKKSFVRLQDDIASIEEMNSRRKVITSSKLSNIDKIIALFEDCNRFGTLAFSHAARAGFVAITWLNNFVEMEIISNEKRLLFLKSISSITGEFEQDKYAYSTGELSQEKLIKKYGHLRPGTYELATKAYWEDPERYLHSEYDNAPYIEPSFVFSMSEKDKMELVLNELDTSLSIEKMISFLIDAIKSRELVKFEFTKNLSVSLDLCVELGCQLNFSRDEISYLNYNDLMQLKLNTITIEELHKQVDIRKLSYNITCLIELPSVIREESDFYCFERFTSQPNFVTINKVEAIVHQLDSNADGYLSGKLVLISQADPGYDWLFGHEIAGLITQYGGANSHMAIRAAEIGLPAAIGVGEKLYEKISKMKKVELDCANQVIREVH